MNLEAQAIGNLPLSGYRNFQSLVNLVPGATPVRFQNAVIDTPQRDFTTNVNGQDRGDNNTRVDGAANILVTMPHHMVYVPPVESIEEVNISTNNFDAEQGMTGGAAVTVTTKSGTNQFHGSAFALPHQQRTARLYLGRESRRRNEEAQKHPKHRRRQHRRTHQEEASCSSSRTGKALSSAWAAPRCFPSRRAIFAPAISAESWARPLSDASGSPIMVPTTEGGSTQLRQGMVFDPFTGNLDGTGRSVFSSNGRLNVIPTSRLNPAMMKLLALVPQSQPGRAT